MPTLEVSAVYALPESQVVVTRRVEAGTTVAGLLDVLRNTSPFSTLDLDRVGVGIFGETVERGRVLAEGDRVELYRPLKVDPKAERRRRAEGKLKKD